MNPTLQKLVMVIIGNVLGAVFIDLTAYKSARDTAKASNQPVPAFDFGTFGVRVMIAIVSGGLVGGGWGVVTQQ